MNTQTQYMGITVDSPVIVGSCGLSSSLENLEYMQESGVGAVILKSIFEEQIIYDIKRNANVIAPTDNYGDSYEYIAAHVAIDSLSQYFYYIRKARKKLQIPIVGSIHCYSFENWLTYAKRFEDAGCNALELNMAILPYETTISVDDIERLFQNVIQSLKKFVSIPVSVKLSHNFTDMAKFMQQLSWTGINSITLFNKPLYIDIDTSTETLQPAPKLSAPEELFNTLRWIAILSKKVRCELSASTGVYSADDVVKLLLAGAQTVQVVSCLYKHGIDHIKTLNDGLRSWMEANDYNSIDQFRGKLAVKANDEASVLFRTQFMKYFAEIN